MRAYPAEALLLTPLRRATVFSLVFAAFSSLKFVVRKRMITSWPSCSAHAMIAASRTDLSAISPAVSLALYV